MYFLNGDRIYIKPADGSLSLDAQLEDCLTQMDKINSGKKIFKVNFFADTSTMEGYGKLQNKLESVAKSKIGSPLICGLIAQPPLTCHILAEDACL